MILLLIGDFHIPDRSPEILSEVWQEIQKFKFDVILCTGDLTDLKILDKLESLAPVKNVRGNMDSYYGLRDFLDYLVLNATNCKVGLIHGSGVHPRGNPEQLVKIAQKMEVDILISGHTHAQSALVHNKVLLLNPGSATGCWGGGPATGLPSFQVLEELDDEIKITNIYLKNKKFLRKIKYFDLTNRIIKERFK